MNRKGFKGFTLVELVIVLGVIAILSAVLIPTFVGIMNNSKVNAKYERASTARTDLFLESDEFEALSDMRQYIIVVDDNTYYEINSDGDVVLSTASFGDGLEDYDVDDFIEVQRAYDNDETVKIYQPSALDAYGRAIKARNDYRRTHMMDRSYYEMENYVIKVADDDTPGYRFFKVTFEGEDSGNNGALVEIDQDIETLLSNGYDYVQVTEGEDDWYGIVYKPTMLTQLTYRIYNIESELLTITHNDENMKEGDFIYVIDGVMYVTNSDGIVSPLKAEVNAKSRVQLIDSEVVFDDSELIANGYQKVQTDTISETLRNTITEANRGLSTYSPVDCYVICYGYYDTMDTYQTWTTFRGIYGSNEEITEIVYKSGLSVAGIKRLIVSNTVTTLGYGAFADFEDMEAIVLPETIDTVATNPLTNAKTTEIRIHKLNGVFEDYGHTAIVRTADGLLIAGTVGLLDEEGVLPETVTGIGDYAFESTTLVVIDIIGIPTGVGAFKNCVSLVSVTHDLDTEIVDELFSGCVVLEYFTMPGAVEVIGRDAFKNCVTLLGLDLPVTLTEIKVGAFDNTAMTLYYADSKKTFNDTVTVSADLSKVTIEYAIKDIVYVLGDGTVDPATPNPVKLDPTSLDELVLYSPYISYKYRFIDWSVKGTSTNNPYENIVASADLVNPYKLVQNYYLEDITLTANYELIVFDINYRINGTSRTDDLVSGRDVEFTYDGEFLGEYNTTVSSTITMPQLNKIGYTFDGWSLNGTKLDDGGSTFTQYGRKGNVTLTAVFNVITYTISYEYAGGTVAIANTTSYTIESPTIIISNPTKQDYEFTGWTGSNGDDPQLSVQVDHGSVGDKNYTANYIAIVYSLTYNLDGGADPANPTTFTVDTPNYELRESTKRGYTFRGWSNGITNIGTTFVCANYHSHTRLTAIFEPNVYSITYTGDHVTQYNNATTYTYNTTRSLSLPTMAVGYKFTEWTEEHGWVEGGYLISDDTHAIGDLTITAVSEVIVYTIGYTLNNGLVEGNPTTYNIESADITLINPTRRGYDFRGWTGSNGNSASKSVTIATGTTGNKTYTANWDLITYTISYTLNSGIVSGNPTEYTFESSTIVISNPTRTGYTFRGWTGTDLSVYTNTVTIPNHSTGDKSYTANWQVITYTLSYTLNGGSATNPESYNIETNTFKLNNPTKTAYEFTGWTGTDITGKSTDVTISKGSIGNRSFTATYTPIIYTLSYNLNGGTVATTNPTTYTVETTTFTLNNPTRTGYTFDGWTGSNGDTPQTTITIAKGSMENRSYVANWTVITYTLSYSFTKTISGETTSLAANQVTISPANPTTYNVETTTFVLTNPTKTGYTFNGWSGTGITGKSTSVTVAKGSLENREYVGNFTRNTYTISYTMNNGVIDGTNPSSYHVETASFTLINPTRTGYTFDGWSGTGISGNSTSVTVTVGSTGNRTYTANFTVITYSLTYTLNGGTASNPTSYTVESNQFTLANPTRTGYTFDGWTGSNGSTPSTTVTIPKGSTGNKSYTANWSIITYTISYTMNNGAVATSNPMEYTVETETFTLNNPTRSGYTFDGWTGTNGTSAQTSVSVAKGSTGNRNYTANFTVVTYTISYTLNSGTVATANPSSYTVETANITLNNPTRTGYTFDGWTGSNGSTKQTSVTINKGSTGNKSYTANWSAINYTISYTLNGGSQTSAKTSYTIETATFTLVNPTRTGYTFTGWTGSNGSTAQTSVSVAQGSTGNRSYTANWTVVSYSITYTLNGGSVSTANPSSYNIETATFTLNNPTRTGYSFNGWSGSGSGTSVSVAKGSTGNKSFTANWKANTYTVTLNQQSGSGGTGSVTATYGNSMPSATAPSRTGYTFGGYYTSTGGGGTQYYNSSMGSAKNWAVAANSTLYAKWTANTYTITLDRQSGSGGDGSKTATYNSTVPNISVPSRSYYSFGGYYTSTGGGGTCYYNSSGVGQVTWTRTSGITLYAKWTATYNPSKGSTSGSYNSPKQNSTYPVQHTLSWSRNSYDWSKTNISVSVKLYGASSNSKYCQCLRGGYVDVNGGAGRVCSMGSNYATTSSKNGAVVMSNGSVNVSHSGVFTMTISSLTKHYSYNNSSGSGSWTLGGTGA